MWNYVDTYVIISCGLKSEILNNTQLENLPEVSKDQTLKTKAAFCVLNLF